MMQMLGAGGMPLLTDSVRVPDESNPRGYFEFDPVKRLRTDCSWLDQARGKAVKIIHLLLSELPVNGAYAYRVIFMQRPIEEVLASQRTMLTRQGKTAGDDAILAKAFASQSDRIDRWLGSQSVFSLLRVDYHAVLEDAASVVAKINAFLSGGLDTAAMIATVDPALYRERK